MFTTTCLTVYPLKCMHLVGIFLCHTRMVISCFGHLLYKVYSLLSSYKLQTDDAPKSSL